MAHEEQLALRTWRSQLERAGDLARTMQRLPRYELLGVTKTWVLRLALVDGLEVAEQADRKYFIKEEAQRLLEAIDRGLVVNGLRLPIINSLNVMRTPTPYSDRLLAQGIVDLQSRKLGKGKEELVNIRLPRRLKKRLDKIVDEILMSGSAPEMESTSAVLRLLLEIGLFWMEYKVYREAKAPRKARATVAPTPLP